MAAAKFPQVDGKLVPSHYGSRRESGTRNTSNIGFSIRFSFSISVHERKKNPYTEAEKVVKSCLKIAVNLLHGEMQAADKMVQIRLFGDTRKFRSAIIVKDLKQQLIVKLLKPALIAL